MGLEVVPEALKLAGRYRCFGTFPYGVFGGLRVGGSDQLGYSELTIGAEGGC
jgi:hypothetical protein